MKFNLKFEFDNEFFFGMPAGYRSPRYKGFELTLLWLWFSIRAEGDWKKNSNVRAKSDEGSSGAIP